MAFQAKYHFKKDNKVVIEHPHGKTLRVKVKNNDVISTGGRGKFARWNVVLVGDDEDTLKIRLQSCVTEKYMRIMRNGDINVNGGLGALTIFKVHVVEEPNVVKLESDKFPGKYVSVKPNGNVNIGNGGKHTVMTFFRNAPAANDGGDDGAAAAEEAKAEEDDDEDDDDDDEEEEKEDRRRKDSDSKEYDADADKDAEDIKVEEAPEPLGEDAEAVKAWLGTIGQSDYVDAFLDNGYDKMGTVSMVTEEDLDKMGVKAGHRKEIMLAARAAPFINHWVGLRSQHKKRYLAADEGNKQKVELDDKCSEKDAWWFVEQSPNGNNLIRLRSKYNSYLRMMSETNKHLRTISKEKDIDERCDLQILNCTDDPKQNVVRIWCPKNANFMTYDDNILKDRVNSEEESFDDEMLVKQKWEIIVKN